MTSKEIIRALEEKLSVKHACFAEVKDGPTVSRGGAHRRVDFIAIKPTWSPVTIKGFEVKVSRADFLGDTKWTEYLTLCNQFYWACPKGLIKRDEIGPKCGLVYINPKSMKATTVKAAIYRQVEPDPLMLLYLIICRDAPQREKQVNAIRLEMAENKEVGQGYARFVSKKLQQADEMVRECVSDVPADVLEVTEWMKANGVRGWGSRRVLDRAKELNMYGPIKDKILEMAVFMTGLSKAMRTDGPQ